MLTVSSIGAVTTHLHFSIANHWLPGPTGNIRLEMNGTIARWSCAISLWLGCAEPWFRSQGENTFAAASHLLLLPYHCGRTDCSHHSAEPGRSLRATTDSFIGTVALPAWA